MVTGYDIIFFWVARMIFSGMEQMDKEPFKTVFIHGLVRDSQGRKMSKSLGNGIDPLEVIEKYGADALRYNLITGNSPGNDMRFYGEKCEAMRNFCQQALERIPLRADEPRRYDKSRSRPKSSRLRTSGFSPSSTTSCQRGLREYGQLRAGRRRGQDIRLHLGHATATGTSN